ncbi:unnamed protein product, partial [Polarella glacialis]
MLDGTRGHVKKAKSIETASNDTLGASGPREGVVLQAGKRASLEENYKKVTGTRPPLQEQGSDAFLSAHFKMWEKGEIGFFQTKQMVSVMPDPLEMAPSVKGLKPVNGFLYQDDQEERKNPYSKEQWESVLIVFQTNLLRCVWAFPNNRLFDLEKSDLDAFYKFLLGEDIAKRSPAPPLHVLMYAERTAWWKMALLIHEGLSLKTALNRIMANSLFWTRDIYEKVSSEPKGKGKKARDGSRTPKPTATPAGGGKWPAEWAESNAKGQQYCKNYHLRTSSTVSRVFKPAGGATGTEFTSSATERSLQGASGPDINRSTASVEAGPAKVQKIDFILKPRVPSLVDNRKVPPSAERQTSKGKTADTAGAHLRRPLQTSLEEPSPWFPWLQHVPPRLRNRLRWDTSHSTSIPDRAIVILFAGKEDPTSLESAIHSIAPELSNSVVAIDLCRGKGNDLLVSEPYSSLCAAGIEGQLDHCGGGPMRRTWTARLWIPKEGGGVPLRGRSEATLWGLPTLADSQRIKCDGDSMLMLRQLYLSSLAKMGNQLCSSFLEHPADPALFWITKTIIAWGKELSLKLMIFDQRRLGQMVPKTTGSMTDLCLNWDKSFCNHADRRKDTKILASGDLSRYPWGMMMDIANAIAAAQKATSGASGPEGIGKEEIVQTGFKRRPIGDGGGEPSPGRRAPPKRSLTALATVGTAIMNACASAAHDIMASLARQDNDMPFEPAMMNTIGQLMCSGSWEVTKGQAFYLDLMTHAARKAFDIDYEYPQELKVGVPLGVDEETLSSPGEYCQEPWWLPPEHIPTAEGASGPDGTWDEE